MVVDSIYIERKTVKWLTDQIKLGLLSVDNSFQRQYIWTVKNQVKLIETILLGYAIPEIYLWEQNTDSQSGNTELSIIDGQQRLGSVFDFINDKFSLQKSFLDDKGKSYSNKTFSELTEEERNSIWKYPVAVRFIKDDVKRDDIINMFLRLNSTTSTLNPQELRNAEFDGLFLRLSGELAELDVWEEIGLFTGLDYRRMKDIEFISSLLMFIRFGIEEEVSQANINKAYDTFNQEYEDYEKDYNLVKDLTDDILKFAHTSHEVSNFLKRKVHFYTLFNIVYYLKIKQIEVNKNITDIYNYFVGVYNHLNKAEEGIKNLDLIKEYNALSQEGTQRKGNRMRRFEIVKRILEV